MSKSNVVEFYTAIRDYFWYKTFKREVCAFWADTTGFVLFNSNNNPGDVEFNWYEIWENNLSKLQNSNKFPSYAIMLHTHPDGINGMSNIDRNMVFGWRRSLGIPIFFTVVMENKSYNYLCDRIPNSGTNKKEGINPVIIKSLGVREHFDLGVVEQSLVYVLRGLSKRDKVVTQRELKDVCKTFNQGDLCHLRSFTGS